jgi:hypothetical protein
LWIEIFPICAPSAQQAAEQGAAGLSNEGFAMNIPRKFKLFCTFMLLGTLATGCCKKDGAPGESAPGESAPAAKPGAATGTKSAQLKIEKANVEFTPPAGWEQEQKNDWTIVHAQAEPSGNIPALVAFVTFNQPNESTAKLGTLAGVFGLNNISWGARENLDLPGGFPATGAGGTCKDGDGNPCEIHYLTINPGGSEQILFVYIVDGDKAAAYKNSAVQSLKTLKKSE